MSGQDPAVSVILPTYNRARFLPEALRAIQAQTYGDWELIVVDDGSTDDSAAVIGRETKGWSQAVRYVRQENQGAYAARNTGLDLARGECLAFYDSDDLWLPEHVGNCMSALEAHPEVDWVFAACRRVDHDSGRTLRENTFYSESGKPWPFLRLRTADDGALRILSDPTALECMLSAGFNCGLQSSVIRRAALGEYRFQTRFWNEAEDQMLVVWALARGMRLAYFDAVHVIYRVHDANSSAASAQNGGKRLAVVLAETRGYEELLERGVRLSARERRAWRKRLLGQYFWQLGYALHWQQGRAREALAMYRRGLRHWPWDWRCWKSYALCRLRHSASWSVPRVLGEG